MLALVVSSQGWGTTFEPLGLRNFCRQSAVGFGQGYHSKPVPPNLRPHYQRSPPAGPLAGGAATRLSRLALRADGHFRCNAAFRHDDSRQPLLRRRHVYARDLDSAQPTLPGTAPAGESPAERNTVCSRPQFPRRRCGCSVDHRAKRVAAATQASCAARRPRHNCLSIRRPLGTVAFPQKRCPRP